MEQSEKQPVIVGGKTIFEHVWRDRRHTKPAVRPLDGERGYIVFRYEDKECSYREDKKAWVPSASIPEGEKIVSAQMRLR